MTKAGDKLLEAVDEIKRWVMNGDTATIWIDGERREMTREQYLDHMAATAEQRHKHMFRQAMQSPDFVAALRRSVKPRS